ncbi:hypothetical protein [Nereida sp. MMG025]|uniref:hypothetical protein n=1 Tax=Nereida sp. MMG025 TaxID=2909981 RepID=UPI001F28B6C1|nr:hypothetical protein [Nereida sp. MMG025]MCF6446080.1 hypothetical protein [Nereida sp. MMG025]
MTTYVITFIPNRSQNFAPFLTQMAQNESRITVSGGMLTIDLGPDVSARFEVLPRSDWVIQSRGAVEDAALFVLLRAYFATSTSEEPGILVAAETDGQARLIAIADDDGEEQSPDPLTVTVSPNEILANSTVFESAWPIFIIGEPEDEDSPAEQGDIISLPNSGGLAIASLFAVTEIEREPMSFLVFNATPDEVVTEMLMPDAYEKVDDGFAVIELEEIDEQIEVASFNTDKGPVSELRVPLGIDQIDSLLSQLSPRVPLDASFGHVLDVDDASESFTVQMIDRSGFLNEIVTVRLLF